MIVQSIWKGEMEHGQPIPRPLPGDIISDVAARHGLTRAHLESPCRTRRLAAARQEAMWELRQRTTLSLPRIGYFLGGRDHTTVMHGIGRHEERRAAKAAEVAE